MSETNTQTTETVDGRDAPAENDGATSATVTDGLPQDERSKLNAEAAKWRVEAKKLKEQLAQVEAERQERERQEAEATGRFEDLYKTEKQRAETLAADIARLQAEMKAQQLQMARQQIAAAKGLPQALADRLVGETPDELEADADRLLEALPRPAAPKLDGAARSSNGVDLPPDDVLNEKANRLGVKPELFKKAYLGRS